MQKSFYIIVVILMGLLVAGGLWMLPSRNTAGPQSLPGTSSYPQVDNSTIITPGANGTSTKPVAKIAIVTRSGKTIAVNDFVRNGETVPDTVNPGYYFLAGSIGYCLGNGTCPEGYKTDDFSISYHETDATFSIILLKEPLAKARDEAGIFMLNRLGVTAAQLCNLKYWLATTAEVNPIYAGKNLGFSFCPGALSLQ